METKTAEWVVVGLKSDLPDWTSEEMSLSFQDFELILRPETDDLAATVCARTVAPQKTAEARKAIYRFLSAFAWLYDGHGRVQVSMESGGSFPIQIGRGPGEKASVSAPRRKLRLEHLQQPEDPKTWLALGIYREACYVNSVSYELLGFLKVINILADKGSQQIQWIEKAIPLLKAPHAVERLKELAADGEDVARYLYVWGRCAVAHAHNDPVVDPDDPEALLRVRRDLPLARALAEHAIEHALGVKSTGSIFREHLYELAGFRALFGDDLVQRIKANEEVPLSDLPLLPRISIRFRDKDPLTSLAGMKATPLHVQEGAVQLYLVSDDGLAEAVVGLMLVEERLAFDFQRSLRFRDDGSPGAIEKLIDHSYMLDYCIANGQFELWQTDTETLLARTDPIIPMNIDGRRTREGLEKRREKLVAEMERRRSAREA